MPRKVWTGFRRWMSNLAPLLVVAPLPPAALWLHGQGRATEALYVWGASPIVFWLSINFLGLFQNEKMKRVLRPPLRAAYPKKVKEATFAGFARPKYRGPLHPHEEVGWLLLHPDRIEFFGESQKHSLRRGEIAGAKFLWNVHSLLGLGRWICIEGRLKGKRVRMLVEPRERRTLLGNRLLAKRLLKEIREWAKGGR